MNKFIAFFFSIAAGCIYKISKQYKRVLPVKIKKQKTIGWVMLGGGVATSFISLTQLNFAGSNDGM